MRKWVCCRRRGDSLQPLGETESRESSSGSGSCDLGCGDKKIPGAFGVDFVRTKDTDLQWDLEKALPKKFWHSYDLVYSASVLDHLGNPLIFLENCAKYAKPGGFVQVIVDNGDYWRFHKKTWPFGNYHSTLWFKESSDIKVQHKMMFQMGHLENLFAVAGLKAVKKEFFYRSGRGNTNDK